MKALWHSASFHLKSRIFQWRQDVDGDLSLVVLGVVAFTKYKEHTVVSVPGDPSWPIKPAAKWQGYQHPKQSTQLEVN